MASANPSVDALIASTQRYYANDEFANQVFNGRPMLKWLKANGRTKEYDGGAPILEPLISEESTSFQWQAALTEVNFAAQNGFAPGTDSAGPASLHETCRAVSDRPRFGL